MKFNLIKYLQQKIGSFSFGESADKEYFLGNLAMLLTAGISINVALDSIAKEMKSFRIKQKIRSVQDDIQAGQSLSQAFKETGLFSRYAIEVIKFGEQSGNLADNLELIAKHQEKRRQFKSKFISAIMYPAIITTATMVVGLGIAWFILPRLSEIFVQFDAELPLFTRVILNIGIFLQDHGFVFIPFFVISLSALVYFLFFFNRTKYLGEAILFSIPPLRKFLIEIELARFGYNFGTLLQAGLPIRTSFDSIIQMTDTKRYQELFTSLRKNIDQGISFHYSLKAVPSSAYLIPGPVRQLLVAAEQSGNLSEILLFIGEKYESKADITVQRLPVILEPVLLIIIWAVVLAIAMSVIFPLYQLVGEIR